VRYKVIVIGMQSGVTRADFLVNLAAALETNAKTVEQVFSRAGFTVSQNVDLATAKKYVAALEARHCVCRIVERSTGQILHTAGEPMTPPLSAPSDSAPQSGEGAAGAAQKGARPNSVRHPWRWVAFTALATLGFTLFDLHIARRHLGALALDHTPDAKPMRPSAPHVGPAAEPAAPGGQPDIQVLSSTEFTPSSGGEKVSAAVAQAGGGLLAVTRASGAGLFMYRLSPTGSVLWRKALTVPLNAVALAAGSSEEGGYWIGGLIVDPGRAPDGSWRAQDFTQAVTADGAIAAPLLLRPSDSRNFACAVEHQGGFVQLGSAVAQEGNLQLPVPSVSMMDLAGHPLWEHQTPTESGHRLDMMGQDSLRCAGLVLTQAGRIVTAASVLVFPAALSTDAAAEEMKLGIHLRSGTLLSALDLDGKVRQSALRVNSTGALLLAGPDGSVLLFESPMLKAGLAVQDGVSGQGTTATWLDFDKRLRLHTLNSDLTETKSPTVFENSAMDRVEAAYVTPEGGVLFKGCPGSDSNQHGYLRYVSPSGAVSPKRPIPDLGEVCGGIYRFAAGAHPDEALLLAQTPQQGNRLLSVRYVD